jgi:hypothetical protein
MIVNKRLRASCSVLAITCFLGLAAPALGQETSNAELYKLIMKLQARQSVLENKLKAADAEINRLKSRPTGKRREVVAVEPAAAQPVEAVAPPPAPSRQAVSAPNFKLEAGGGGGNGGGGFGYVGGSAAVPLGEPFGFQIDALGGMTRDNGFAGAAGHAFWRDPQVGAIGAYGSYVYGTGAWASNTAGMYNAKAGLEGQLYWGRLSFEGIAGAEWSRVGDGLGVDGRTNEVRFFDDARIA